MNKKWIENGLKSNRNCKGKIWNVKQYDSKNNLVGEENEGKGIIKKNNTKGNVIAQFEILFDEKNGKYTNIIIILH